MKYTIKKLQEGDEMKLSNLIAEIKSKIIINNDVNHYISRFDEKYIISMNLCGVIDNIYYYTNYLEDNAKFSDRVNLILNGLPNTKVCKCGKIIKKIKRNGSKAIGFNDYCSQSCANRFTNYKKSAEFYKKVSEKIVKTRKKNNSYKVNDAFKNCMKNPEIREKAKNTNLKRYGVENAGVMGAYSSKAAESFIRRFIAENKITEERCFFKNGGVNGMEFFQMIYSETLKKKIYISYDLVVFKDESSAVKKDLNNIELILEYNGPWHYKENEVKVRGNLPATPYKKSKTIKETYEFDLFKMNVLKKYCDNFLIYWEKDKCYGDY